MRQIVREQPQAEVPHQGPSRGREAKVHLQILYPEVLRQEQPEETHKSEASRFVLKFANVSVCYYCLSVCISLSLFLADFVPGSSLSRAT